MTIRKKTVTIKKCMSMLLAVVFLFGFAVPTFATLDEELTVHNSSFAFLQDESELFEGVNATASGGDPYVIDNPPDGGLPPRPCCCPRPGPLGPLVPNVRPEVCNRPLCFWRIIFGHDGSGCIC